MTGSAQAAAAAAVAQCVSDIQVADFVALDLEFSGLFVGVERDRRPLSQEEYFKKCVESIPQFLPLQLGICCARLKPQQPSAAGAAAVWELRAHEFNLWPQERRIFVSDMQSLRFLRAHGFDFNAFFEHAHAYARLPGLGAAEAQAAAKVAAAVKRLPHSHATRIFAALQVAQVPIVVHNGLLDLLHLYDKFLGDLPSSREAFGERWLSCFPLLFDTRVLAHEGRFQVLKHSGSLSLEELHRHLSTLEGHVSSLGGGGGGAKPGVAKGIRVERHGSLLEDASKKRAAHGSSAFDAVLTAEVFLFEVDLWLRSGHVPPGSVEATRKRKAVTVFATADDGDDWSTVPVRKKHQSANSGASATLAAAAGRSEEASAAPTVAASSSASSTGLSSAALLETHDVCRHFHNRVAIVGAAPGYMNLGSPSSVAAGLGLAVAPSALFESVSIQGF